MVKHSVKAWILFGLVNLTSSLSAQQNRLEPIFPPATPGLVYWEAESAVVTNFARQAILDYSASGQRELQLNTATVLPDQEKYFADYVVRVPESGQWTFWWGGTPPGPQDELAPSYASPFSISVDGGPAIPVYREGINVVSSYSPLLFWNRVKVPLNLTAGIHKIRLEVLAKRRYDGRFFLYLDAFFLHRQGYQVPPETQPSVFPKNLNDRSLDTPYLSISDYQYQIHQNPQLLAPYWELAQVYTLLTDYGDALKILAAARLQAPDNPDLILWMAKDNLWAGEVDDALRYYQIYLQRFPKSVQVWAEVAKEMAWLGRYQEALSLYNQGLADNPGNLNLQINKALTLLWAGQGDQGQNLMDQVQQNLGEKRSSWLSAAQIYNVNGYPDHAEAVLNQAISRFPRDVQFRLTLLEILTSNGQTADADRVRQEILADYQPSERLKGLLNAFEEEQGVRQSALEDDRAKLEQNPDNLLLRHTYIDALFWNGKKAEAVKQYQALLVDRLYRKVKEAKNASADTYRQWDEAALLNAALEKTSTALTDSASKISLVYAKWQQAENAVQTWGKLDPKKFTPAQKQLAQADEQKLQQAQAALALAVQTAQGLSQDTEGMSAEVVSALSSSLISHEQQKAKSDLKKLAGPLHWQFDRKGTFQDLDTASASGLVLADEVKLLLESLMGQVTTFPNLSSLGDEGQAVLFETKLWQKPKLPRQWPPAYLPYLPLLQEKVKEWTSVQPPSGVWSASIPASANLLLKTLPTQAGVARESAQKMVKYASQLKQLLWTRMKIQLFAYDQETVQERYQLGEYLIDLPDLPGALRQLGRVTQLDPWNHSALFRLGNVAEMLGDWSRAMSLYRKVYETDPKYANAQNLFNRLARAHPWKLSAQDQDFLDSLRYQRTTDLKAEKDFSPWFSGLADYGTMSAGLHDHHGGYEQTHASLKVAFHPFNPQFTLSAKAGGAYWSNVWHQSVTSEAKLASQLTWSIWNLGASYDWSVLPDSQLDEGPTLQTGTAEGTASFYVTLPNSGTVRSFSGRSYGQFQNLSDGNSILTASQELSTLFHVADAPWTSFVLIGSAVWQSSAHPAPINAEGDSRYYAPAADFTLKFSPEVVSWISLGGKTVLGLTARGAWGPYWQNFSLATQQQYWVNEVEVRAELDWGDWSAWADLYYSTTPIANQSSYWSSQATIGIQAALPDSLVSR